MDCSSTQDALWSNIYYSLKIKKGSFFVNTNFGSAHSDIKKVTANAADDIKDAISAALKWILDLGRASTIDIVTDIDDSDRCRCNILIKATKPSGEEITFTTFYRVV
jgi:hypothetical protein